MEHSEYDKEKEKALRFLRNEIIPRARWYSRRLSTPRWVYLTSVYAIVVFGATIPFLAALPKNETIVGQPLITSQGLLSFLSLSVAILTGLNAALQYQQTWHSRMSAYLRIEFLIQEYIIDTEVLGHQEEVEKSIQELWNKTGLLLEQVKEVVLQETDTFFSSLRTDKTIRDDRVGASK